MIRAILALALAAGPASAAAPAKTRAPYGILILAHGSGALWDAQISEIRRAVNAEIPTETAFGMADPESIQAAIDRLEARGVSRIAAVPLFINSQSEVMDQTRYVLGLSPAPSQVFIQAMEKIRSAAKSMDMPAAEMAMMGGQRFEPYKKIKAKALIVLTKALDDDPIGAAILVSRAEEMSRAPSKETVILVGHGPVDDAENAAWLVTMAKLCRKIQKAGGFKAAWAATIRDDSPAPVKAKADAALRAMVRRADARGGRVLIIPDLIARGGIETHITAILRGLSYAWDDKPLCPDPRLALWVRKRARDAFIRTR